jgi:hypothetical protein
MAVACSGANSFGIVIAVRRTEELRFDTERTQRALRGVDFPLLLDPVQVPEIRVIERMVVDFVTLRRHPAHDLRFSPDLFAKNEESGRYVARTQDIEQRGRMKPGTVVKGQRTGGSLFASPAHRDRICRRHSRARGENEWSECLEHRQRAAMER